MKLTATGDTVWTRCYGGSNTDYPQVIRQTTDGGYIMVGISTSTDGNISENHGYSDYWVLKLTATGNIEWSRNYGGSSYDQAYDIQQTTDGGYIVAGLSQSTDGDVTGNHGGYGDYWILKLTATGDTVWTKCYGGSDQDWTYAIQQTTDEGYIVAGISSSTDGDVNGHHGNYNFDYWILKLTITGDIEWSRCYGGYYEDKAHVIQQTDDGGYIVAGETISTDGDVTGNHGDKDYWVLKLTATGDTVWTKCYGGSGDDIAAAIQQTDDGGYIVAGETISTNGDVTGNHGGEDFWILKLTATGDTVWTRCYGGSNDDMVYAIQQTSDGKYIVAGYSQSTDGNLTGNYEGKDSWILKLGNSNGIPTQNIKQMAVYPNPAHNKLLITATTNQAIVTIYDTKGQQVLQKNLSQKNATIDISTLAKGSYVLTLSENDKIKVGKFVKE